MKWTALAFSLLAFQSLAQAQWADQDGFVDYGMTHRVIVNGDSVPTSESMIYYGTVQVLSKLAKGTGNCSGTVIAPNVILTAAHCFMQNPKPEGMKIVVAGVAYGVAAYKSHEFFRYLGATVENGIRVQARTENDVALVFLKKNLPARSVPALLPPQGWAIDGAVAGVLAGFGMTTPDQLKTLGTLRWVEAEIEEMGDTNLRIYGTQNFCQGDSGGPAYMKKGDRYSVIGISSMANCEDLGVVVRVSDHVNWIHGQIAHWNSLRSI